MFGMRGIEECGCCRPFSEIGVWICSVSLFGARLLFLRCATDVGMWSDQEGRNPKLCDVQRKFDGVKIIGRRLFFWTDREAEWEM